MTSWRMSKKFIEHGFNACLAADRDRTDHTSGGCAFGAFTQINTILKKIRGDPCSILLLSGLSRSGLS